LFFCQHADDRQKAMSSPTEIEFSYGCNQTLNSPRGLDGPPGLTGPQGPAGAKGPEGLQGQKSVSQSSPDTRSQPALRARPTTQQELVLNGEKGRELRVVVNTKDPEYEHVYSIEALDDPMDDLLYFSTESANHTEGSTEMCLLPIDEGSCQRYTLRWYFNSQVRACRPFIYSGCEGNDNRFLHLEECEETCLRETEGTGRNAQHVFR
ncbi:hypothetical protein GOODEAATRI_008542, partial [Goodea atripinnis]